MCFDTRLAANGDEATVLLFPGKKIAFRRTERADQMQMDPGVLAPNSVLEAVAWRDPETAKDLEDLPELKGWFRREFGAEITRASLAAASDPPKLEAKPRSGRRGRGGRGRRNKSAAKSADSPKSGEKRS